MGNKQSKKGRKWTRDSNVISVIDADVVRKQLVQHDYAKLVGICRMNNLSHKGGKLQIITRLIRHLNEYNHNIIHSCMNSHPVIENVKPKARKSKTSVVPTDHTYPSNGGSLEITTINLDYTQLLNDPSHVYTYERPLIEDKKDADSEAEEERKEDTSNHPDYLTVNKRYDAIEDAKISSFMVTQLHRDLNLNLCTKSTELADTLMAKLSNHMYSMQYPSNEIPRMTYCKGCVQCDDILYLNLTKPNRKLSQTFMVNIFRRYRKSDRYLNRPTRHIFNVNRKHTFKDLANQISHMHKVPTHVILFHQNVGHGILRSYNDNQVVCRVARNDKTIQCHMVQDYNLEYSINTIQRDNVKLIHCHLRHISATRDANNSYQFGIPIVITITSKHSIFDVYTMVYEYLYHVLGSRHSMYAPTQMTRNKVIISDNLNKFGHYEDWYWQRMNYTAYVNDWCWKIRNAPFALRVLPHKYYRFQDPAQLPWPDKMNIEKHLATEKNFCEQYLEDEKDQMECSIAIEWKVDEATDRLQRALSTIYVSKQYKKWKHEMSHLKKEIKTNMRYTLYDYIENHRLNDNYMNFNAKFCENRCDIHADLNEKLRTFNFTPCPGIVSFRLQFEQYEFVDYPIDYDLDLLKYNQNNQIKLYNSLLLCGFIREIQNKLCSNFRYMDCDCLVSLCMNYCDPYYAQTMYSLYAILYPNHQRAIERLNGKYSVFFKIHNQWFGFSEFEVKAVEKDDILFAGARTPLVLFYQQCNNE